MLRYLLLSISCLLLLTACGDSPTDYGGGKEFAPPKSSQDLIKVSENQIGKAQAQGLLIEEFRCFSSRSGYGAKVRITNYGKTLNDVAVEVYALAGDKVEIASTRSVVQDLPNGITGNFEAHGLYSNPSFIKFCDVRIVKRKKAENMKDVKKAFEGKNYQTLKFKTAKGLELPIFFNKPSNKPFGLIALSPNDAQATLAAMATRDKFVYGGMGDEWKPRDKDIDQVHHLQTVAAPKLSVDKADAIEGVTQSQVTEAPSDTNGPTPEPIPQEGLVGHWRFNEDTKEPNNYRR